MNNIRPFRFWCQKVLPLVYDDSLSYYELLCKIVAKLNEVVDNENQLNEAFQQLKNWVENYFDSHDFQQMVNDKLDSMVEDGTLGSLINDKLLGDINAKVENNTNDISAMKPKVEQLESNVANNTNTINNHTQRITALEGWSLKGKQIDWFGDSLIYGEGTDGARVSKPIPALFSDWTGANCINHAVSGATISNNEWATKIIDQITSANLSNSEYIIVQGGINDYVLNYPIGVEGQSRTFKDGLANIFNSINTKNPSAKIIMLTLFPNSAMWSSLGHDGSHYVNYNNAIKQICKDKCIRCIDMSYNSINKAQFSIFSTGTHFTQDGYTMLTKSVLNGVLTSTTELPQSSGNNILSGAFKHHDINDSWVSTTENAFKLSRNTLEYTVTAYTIPVGRYTVSFDLLVNSGVANVYFGTDTSYNRLTGAVNVEAYNSIFVHYDCTFDCTDINGERFCFLLSNDSTAEEVYISNVSMCRGEIPCIGDTCYNNRANVNLNHCNLEYPMQFKQRDRFISFNGPVQTTQVIPARTQLADLSNYIFAKGKYSPNNALIYATGLDGTVYPLMLDLSTYILENLKEIPDRTNLGISGVIDIS